MLQLTALIATVDWLIAVAHDLPIYAVLRRKLLMDMADVLLDEAAKLKAAAGV